MFGDINLLPDEIIYRKLIRLKFAGKVFSCLLAILILASALLILPYRRWRLEDRLSELNLEINQRGLIEIQQAEKRLSEKKEEVSKFNKISGQIPDNTVRITGVVDGIFALMPASLAVESINYDYSSGSLTVNMVSSSREDIALFLKRLCDERLYSDINISAINGVDPDFSFSVVLTLKQDRDI